MTFIIAIDAVFVTVTLPFVGNTPASKNTSAYNIHDNDTSAYNIHDNDKPASEKGHVYDNHDGEYRKRLSALSSS